MSTLPLPPRADESLFVTPHSIDAEQSVLGAAMVSTKAADYVADNLTKNSFLRRVHQIAFTVIQDLREQKSAVDIVTFRNRLVELGKVDEAGGTVYISQLADGVPKSTNVEYYVRILKDLEAKRALVDFSRLTFDLIAAGQHSSKEILDDTDRRLVELRFGHTKSNSRSLGSSMPDIFKKMEQRVANRGKLTGLDTGFTGVNELTLGFQRKDLIAIGARPSIGKSTLAGNIAVNVLLAAPELHVGLFSMEMSAEQVWNRILAQLTQIDLSRIMSGALSQAEFARIAHALEQMRAMNLHINDTRAMLMGDIRAECRRLKAEGGLDLFITDYMQLMPGSLNRKSASRNDELSDIAVRHRDLAGELDATSVIVSQLRRIHGRPSLDDFRDCGAIEQVIDVGILLHRAKHTENDPTELWLAKQRNGPTGLVMLTTSRETATFTEAPQGTQPETPADAEEDPILRKQVKPRRHKAQRASV